MKGVYVLREDAILDAMKLLVTGFEPFGDVRVNPSEFLMDALSKMNFDPAVIKTLVLPVTLDAATIVEHELSKSRYDAIIHFGVAAKRGAITPERVAINCLDFGMPDNDGKVFRDEPIKMCGPTAYFSTLPNRDITDALKGAGFDAEISNTAGTYLCNYVMYRTLNLVASKGWKTIAGFIHLPPLGALPPERLIVAGELILGKMLSI